MNFDIDNLISIMKSSNSVDSELGEQDAAAGGSSGGGGAKPAYPTVTKWETGLTRGPANNIDAKKKWSEFYPIKRGKANTLL